LADALALAAPIGLFLGRIANFINGELVGRPTDVPWGVVFPGDTFARHPSQLYEALLEGPILFAALWAARGLTRSVEGRTAALFLISYGAFRFGVEFSREPDAQLGFIAFGWLTMGQLLSAALAIAGAGLWIIQRPPASGRAELVCSSNLRSGVVLQEGDRS
jgi:phosphatidylglycerol:prolipoprotein diacylglycerol transferase